MVDQKDDDKEELSSQDADNPLEEAGPERCEAHAPDCELGPGERDAPPEECAFTTQEELEEEMEIVPIPLVIAEDGLVSPVTSKQHAFAPAFHEDNIVCLSDERGFVELFQEELLERGWSYDAQLKEYVLDRNNVAMPETIEQGSLIGRGVCALRRVVVHLADRIGGTGFTLLVRKEFDDSGAPRTRQVFRPEEVKTLWGEQFVPRDDSELVPVRPRREKCIHYKRQVFVNDEAPDPQETGHKIHFPNCTMRRSVGGAFLSMKDQAIYACDYRDPPDPATVAKHLDSFDDQRKNQRPDKTFVPLFGLEGHEVKKGTP